MKALFVTLAVLSFNAFAYEINIGNAELPIEVQDSIRTSIDQGYVDDNYVLSFVIITDWSEQRRPDRLLIKVVQPIQERSGRYEPYITDFQTIYGSDGDAICNN